jgi:hypothetical protein
MQMLGWLAGSIGGSMMMGGDEGGSHTQCKDERMGLHIYIHICTRLDYTQDDDDVDLFGDDDVSAFCVPQSTACQRCMHASRDRSFSHTKI